MVSDIALNALEKAVNTYLFLDPEMSKRLQSLGNKVLVMEIKQPAMTFYVQVSPLGLKFSSHSPKEIDTHITASLFTFMKMGLSKNPQIMQDMEIRGDIEFGQAFKNLLDEINIDWEEHLSHIVGDIVAHQVGNAAREFFEFGKNLQTTIQKNCTEYLQEECRHLPTREEFEDWANDVDEIRTHGDRLQARLNRLQQQILSEAS